MQRQAQPGLAPRDPPMKPSASATQKYRGVRRRSSGKWAAEIRQPSDRKRLYLGHFDTAQEAVSAYDQVARRLYGDAASLNYPDKAAVTAAADTAGPVEAEQVAGRGSKTGELAN